MRVPWWYGVAISTLVWVVEVLALGNVPESSPLDQLVAGPLAIATLVAWFAMPVCLYLDQRSARDDLQWSPTTWLWVVGSLIWFVNIVVGTAYCLRRYLATHGNAPSPHWRSLVAASLVVWVLLVGIDLVVPEGVAPPVLVDAMAALVVLAWAAMPIAILLDAARVRGYTNWQPNARRYSLGAAIPLLNLFVGGLYLYRRHAAFEDLDSTRVFSLADADDGAEPATAGSPWFPRAGLVFGFYFLLLVLVGAAAPAISDTGFELLGLLVWVPFGPFFAGCVYKDASWRRANDRPVGDYWWLYLLSTLIQGVAFWYLVRRATKASRIRRRSDAGADG